MKDSTGRRIGGGRLFAFMAALTAIGVAEILYGTRKDPSELVPLVLGGVSLLCVAVLGVSIVVTQWRRRNLPPPD